MRFGQMGMRVRCDPEHFLFLACDPPPHPRPDLLTPTFFHSQGWIPRSPASLRPVERTLSFWEGG